MQAGSICVEVIVEMNIVICNCYKANFLFTERTVEFNGIHVQTLVKHSAQVLVIKLEYIFK